MQQKKRAPMSHDNPVFKELVSLLGNGFILSLFTIDSFCFEYVLPILGSFIMLYGCHLLKEHSIYFKRTYQFAIVRSITMLINFMLDWTKFHDNNAITYIQITFAALLIIGLFFNMNLAFRDIFKQAGMSHLYNNRLIQYILLYLCTIFSTYLTIHLGILGAMISLLLLILNVIFLMLTFYQLGNTLSKIDIDLTITHYGPSEKRKIIIMLGSYTVLLCMIVILSNKALFLPVRSTSHLSAPRTELNEIEKRLLDLGFEKQVLGTLPENEITALASATSLSTDKSTKEINNGTLEVTVYDFSCADDHRVLVHYHWLIPPDSRLYQIVECQYTPNFIPIDITSKAYVLSHKKGSSSELPNISLGLNNASYPYVEHKLSNSGSDLQGYLAFSYHPYNQTERIQKYTIYVYYQISMFNLPYLNILDYMNQYKEHKNSMVFDRTSLTLHLNN